MGLGLYDDKARFYDPALGRFLQSDPLVPEPGNPQALNRYAYVHNNPLRYVDAAGHFPIVPLLVAGALVALKVIDYGWTAWDAYQGLRVVQDSHAATEERLAAGLTVALAALELAEPDELGPFGLPLDDLARRGITAGFRAAVGEGGLRAGVEYLRGALGEKAPGVIRQLYERGLFGEIRRAGEWEGMLQGVRREAGLEVHHLIEQRFAKNVFGVDPDEVPAVVLDREFHRQEVTARLFRALPTNRSNYTPQEIWDAYKKVYGSGPEGLNRPDWLEAIWPYFERLGVQR